LRNCPSALPAKTNAKVPACIYDRAIKPSIINEHHSGFMNTKDPETIDRFIELRARGWTPRAHLRRAKPL
jgi:hypothetical protein